MNRQEYMAALRRALSVLPDEERANALRYYEEYFDDASTEHEQNVIEDLGPPEQVAVQILADYRDLIITASANNNSAPPPPPTPEPQTQTRRGISPAALILLVLLAIPIGIPLAFALFAAVVGILFGGLGILLALAVTILAIPFCVLFAGIAFSAFSFVLWATPASALVTLGSGLALIAVGILLGVLVVKLCILFVPPLTRGFIAILRWPIDKLRNRNQGGTPS